MFEHIGLKNAADRATLIAFAAAYAVLAWFLSPLFRFADPSGLAEAGAWAAIAVALAILAAYQRGEGRSSAPRWQAAFALTAVIAVYWLNGVSFDAHRSALANARRCVALQRDMLSAKPRRTDGPKLFEMLRCEPQGEGSVYAPPRSKVGRPDALRGNRSCE